MQKESESAGVKKQNVVSQHRVGDKIRHSCCTHVQVPENVLLFMDNKMCFLFLIKRSSTTLLQRIVVRHTGLWEEIPTH